LSLEAAARRCCVVEHRGRRYLVSAPTVATLVLTCDLFPKHVASFAKYAVGSPEILACGPDSFRGVLNDLVDDVSDGRAGEVLETCCVQMGGSRGDVLVSVTSDRDLAIALGLAILSLCDIPRCFKGAGWDKVGKRSIEELENPRPAGWVDIGDSAFELGIVALSRDHHCSVMDIMAWPFEVLLLVDEMSALLKDPKALEDVIAAGKEFPLGLGMLSDLGIGYSKEP